MTVIKYGDFADIDTSHGRVSAIGFFDGVHVGHRELFRTAREIANEKGLIFTVFTFISECENIKKVGRLYSTEEKLKLIAELGADEVVLTDFDEIKDLSPADFVEELLIKNLNTVCAVTGKDFRFGKGAVGTADTLSSIMIESGRATVTVDDVVQNGVKVSTTEIKKRLAEGDVRGANEMLGTPYRISAEVMRGRGVGSSLGTPTVNLPIREQSVLKRGVYYTVAVTDGTKYPSITNVGTCPTYGGIDSHSETHIIGFDGNLYGKNISIIFYDFLREEIAFESEKELKMQINIDINRVKKEFLNNGGKLDQAHSND
ncbi:MAG: riboflavin biosynthesis protein RibF [Clostridia bacterium]|nr:riboflavin biosynthesis protein RibF [Clostridia bacterium]